MQKTYEEEIKIKSKIEKRNAYQKNLGITLIALVITIIVLLILAGVTLSLTLGENGLLRRAEESKTAHLRGEQNDIEFMNGAYDYMNPYFGEGGNNQGGGDEPNPPTPPEETSKLTEAEKTALENAGIAELGKDEITNNNLKDNENIKGVITGEVPIPEGAEYKEGTKETGVVIAFDDSEFVWVPVPEISEMARLQSGSTQNYQGVLYNFSETTATEMSSYGIGTTNYREPDALTDAAKGDANTTNLTKMNNILGTNYTTAEQFKTVLQNEYNEMVASVIKYKGFFIGRYETSLDENKRAKSKKGVLPAAGETTSVYTWYRLYAYEKKMAEDNNLTSVKSHMIWGSQYDAMLRWTLTGADKEKVTTTGNAAHSGLGGVYETGKETVSGKVDIINNIYDLEGNGYEWTVEAYDADVRSLRGGNYMCSVSPSSRITKYHSYAYGSGSSRLQLYVK